jgi:hypothetical protein
MLLAEFFEDDFRMDLNEMAEELSDIITARGLIGQAVRDATEFKHKYFEFLKYLREKHGEKYSTRIHQKAAKLAIAKEEN